jgi:Fe-S-cluster-containing dehydrogenase component/formate-dependent nitrite reductase membrane component NrfD
VPNFGFIIDNRRCIGCHACTVACKSEHDVPVGVNRTWVKYIEKGQFPESRRLFSVMRCNHCDDAPCVEICPVTSLFRRGDGIVDFDRRRCIGCKACMQACPYDALYIDPETHTAAKCNYCAHRIDIGLEPACVNVCPTQAIISGDLDDPDSRISRLKSREVVSVRKPEKDTQPALYYIDGDRSSLEPAATQTIGQSLWGQQNAGVGHYAAYLEARVAAGAGKLLPEISVESRPESSPQNGETPVAAEAAPQHPLDRLQRLLNPGGGNDGVLNPAPADEKHTAAARSVETEVTRRVYDSPAKGILWGWQVSAYVWTKAIAAGVSLVASVAALGGLATVTRGIQWFTIVVALIFMGLTGYLLTIDLDQPKRFLYVLLRPQWRSWLVRGAWIISIYSGLLVLWPLLGLFDPASGPSFLMWLVAVASGLTAVYTAFLFAQARGRDFWQSPLLAVHMLLHSAIAGAAVFAVVLPFSGDASWRSLIPNALIVLLIAKLVIDWFELSTTHSTVDAARTAHMITRGSYAKLYWIGVVATGCAIPVALLLIPWVGVAPLAGLLVLAGLYVAEHIWARAPQQIPLS